MSSTKQLEWLGKYQDDERLTPAVRAQVKYLIANPAKPCGNTLTLVFGLCPKETAKPHKHAGTATATPAGQDAFKVFGAEFPGIVPGYYAVPSDGKNDLTFFKVSFGWQFSTLPAMKDRVFVKTVVGGHADTKCDAAHARAYLGKVADAEAARALYGQKIGQCGDCNKALTDQASRDRGFGPDCWANKH